VLIRGGRASRNAQHLDVSGALLVTSATAAFIFGLVRLGGTARGSGVVAVAVAALLYVLFAFSQRRSRHPLIDPRLHRQRSVVTGTAVMLVATALLISAFFLNSLLLQGMLGLSALRTGLAFLPVAVGTVIGAHLAGRLLPRIGPRPVAGAAFALAAIGLALLSGVGPGASVLTAVLPGFTIAALALGAALVTATTTVLTTVDSRVAGTAAGVVNTAHELGAAIGVAAASAVAGIGAVQSLGTVDFRVAFWSGAALAVLAAVATSVWLPRTLPAGGRPAFVH